MSAHGASVLVRSDPRRLLFLAVPTLLITLTEGFTSQGRLLPRPVWFVFGAVAGVFFFVLYWALAVSVADGCVAVRRGSPHGGYRWPSSTASSWRTWGARGM